MDQMTLIPPLDTSRKTARHEAMQAAQARANLGIERVAARADSERPNWCADAAQALRKFAAAQGGVFTIELARIALVLSGAIDKPVDGRAWGKATRMAQSAGYIERVKGQFFPAASSNGSAKPVYRKSGKA